ncbi:DUF4433 domain-containing protein [Rhodovibrionaceae bacterium A322]
MTYYKDLVLFLNDGELRSKNHPHPQLCHQTSYSSIVNRRNEDAMRVSNDSVVNDYVPFYFSPITAMAYAIHMNKVDLKAPSGEVLGRATMDNRIFFVCKTENFVGSDLQYFFSDLACNSLAPLPSYQNDLGTLESHVNWSLFDDEPIVGSIPEIGYNGVCGWFHDRDNPEKHQNRSRQRMAEFLVRDQLPLEFVDCIVVKTESLKKEVDDFMTASSWDIPVLVNRGCYF